MKITSVFCLPSGCWLYCSRSRFVLVPKLSSHFSRFMKTNAFGVASPADALLARHVIISPQLAGRRCLRSLFTFCSPSPSPSLPLFPLDPLPRLVNVTVDLFVCLAWTWFQSGINTDGAHNPVTTRRLQKGDIISLNCFPMIAG